MLILDTLTHTVGEHIHQLFLEQLNNGLSQLMMSMEKQNKTLRENALQVVEDLTFYPEWGRNRLRSMLDGRPDWCISRQRDWGVPIAFFRNKKD